MDHTTIRQIIAQTCKTCNAEHLAARVRYGFSNRFTRQIGVAKTDYSIVFSTKWFRILNDLEITETIVHETCHLVALYLYGRKAFNHKHQWRSLMRVCGYDNANRCVVKTTNPFARHQKRVVITCGCGVQLSLTQNRLGRMRNGAKYQCGRCKSPIEIDLSR